MKSLIISLTALMTIGCHAPGNYVVVGRVAVETPTPMGDSVASIEVRYCPAPPDAESADS